ncbi:hypothetical protein M3685_02350 [Heyndrickxia oleronia]|uniref:hypothetical protein n=1 Tax=Heyndrickxia oleronia TaxID=38875 RepID=UPI00204134BD|nr:hypothetical protein [Heyndrickxia oleronia]MCM3452788.1 hypothetical protein [Heyndrickxia oleronia]
MYYEKFVKDFKESDFSNNYPKDILSNLFQFLKDEYNHGYEFLNPYKFAIDSGISDEKSIQLFLFFTDKDKLFNVEPFIDCPRCTGKRLSLSPEEILDGEIIYCDDCKKEYLASNLQNHLYLYFKINDSFTIPENLKEERFDPHSTLDIWNRLNDNLKEESPSSLLNNLNVISEHVEGDIKPGVSYEQIIKINIDDKGKTISSSTKNMTDNLMNIIIDEAI